MVNIMIYIVSTLLTYTLGLISKHFKWNESVPIPVQNILVGIIVFTIFYVIYKPDNLEDLLQQIITALGGTGTATLGYDTQKLNKGGEQ